MPTPELLTKTGERKPAGWEKFLFPSDPETVGTLDFLSSSLSLDRIQQIFAYTYAGSNLAQTVRFKTFFKPPSCSDAEWEALVGRQGNDLLHGDYTRFTGDILLASEPRMGASTDSRRTEQFLFGFTNLTHDWGEAHPLVGDVAFGETKNHRRKERMMRSGLSKVVLQEACKDQEFTRTDLIDTAIQAIVDWSDRIAFNEPNFYQLGSNLSGLEYYTHLYRANKYIGHFGVALRMGRNQEMGETLGYDTKSELGQGVELLNALVSCNDLGVCIQYAKIFLGVELFLRGYKTEIDNALDTATMRFTDGVIPRDNQELPLTLAELTQAWQFYCDTLV